MIMAVQDLGTSRAWRAAIAVAVALAMVASACGGGDVGPAVVDLTDDTALAPLDDGEEAAATEEPAAAPEPEPTAAEAAPEPTAASEAAPAPTPQPDPAEEPTPAPEPTATPEPIPAPAADAADDDEPVLPAEQVETVTLVGSLPELPPTVETNFVNLEPAADITLGLPSSADDPIAMGQPFMWDEWSVQGEVVLHGLLPVDPTFSSDEGSACFLLFGSYTPMHIEGELAASWTSLPDLILEIEGEDYEWGGSCDDDILIGEGWFNSNNMEAIAGATVDFVFEYLLDDLADPTIDAVRIGDADDEGATWFTPTFLDALPPSTPVTGISVEAPPLAGAVFQAGSSSDTWGLRLHGLHQAPLNDWAISQYGDGTECLVLTGHGFPIEIDEGVVGEAFPDIALLADGQLVNDDFNACDIERFEQAGYALSAGVAQTPGSPVAFMEVFAVTTPLAGTVTNVVVDEWWDEGVKVFTADIVDELPPPPGVPSEPVLPASSGPMDAQTWQWVNTREDGLTWTVDLAGLYDLGAATEGDARCIAAIGTKSPSQDVDKGFQGPDFWIIADGTGIDALDRRCDTTVLDEAGFIPWDDFELGADESHSFYAIFQLPNQPQRRISTFVIGTPTRDGRAIYLDPVRLDQLPSANG